MNEATFSAYRAASIELRSATVDGTSPLTVTLDGTPTLPADRLAGYTPTLNDDVAVLVKPAPGPSGTPAILVFDAVA